MARRHALQKSAEPKEGVALARAIGRGSYDFDRRSLLSQLETATVIVDSDFAVDLRDQSLEDIRNRTGGDRSGKPVQCCQGGNGWSNGMPAYEEEDVMITRSKKHMALRITAATLLVVTTGACSIGRGIGRDVGAGIQESEPDSMA